MATKLTARISVDGKDKASKGFDSATKAAKRFDKQASVTKASWAQTFTALSTGYLAMKAAFGDLTRALMAPLKLAAMNETSSFRLKAALEGLGETTKGVFEDLTNYAGQLEIASGFAGEAVEQTIVLGKAYGMTGDQVKSFTRASAALANLTGKDLATTTEMLKMSLMGQARTLKTIIPAVGNLTAEELRQGKAIAAVNKHLDHFVTATAYTMQGALTRMTTLWENYQKAAGRAFFQGMKLEKSLPRLLNAFQRFLDVLMDGNGGLEEFGETVANKIVGGMEALADAAEKTARYWAAWSSAATAVDWQAWGVIVSTAIISVYTALNSGALVTGATQFIGFLTNFSMIVPKIVVGVKAMGAALAAAAIPAALIAAKIALIVGAVAAAYLAFQNWEKIVKVMRGGLIKFGAWTMKAMVAMQEFAAKGFDLIGMQEQADKMAEKAAKTQENVVKWTKEGNDLLKEGKQMAFDWGLIGDAFNSVGNAVDRFNSKLRDTGTAARNAKGDVLGMANAQTKAGEFSGPIKGVQTGGEDGAAKKKFGVKEWEDMQNEVNKSLEGVAPQPKVDAPEIAKYMTDLKKIQEMRKGFDEKVKEFDTNEIESARRVSDAKKFINKRFGYAVGEARKQITKDLIANMEKEATANAMVEQGKVDKAKAAAALVVGWWKWAFQNGLVSQQEYEIAKNKTEADFLEKGTRALGEVIKQRNDMYTADVEDIIKTAEDASQEINEIYARDLEALKKRTKEENLTYQAQMAARVELAEVAAKQEQNAWQAAANEMQNFSPTAKTDKILRTTRTAFDAMENGVNSLLKSIGSMGDVYMRAIMDIMVFLNRSPEEMRAMILGLIEGVADLFNNIADNIPLIFRTIIDNIPRFIDIILTDLIANVPILIMNFFSEVIMGIAGLVDTLFSLDFWRKIFTRFINALVEAGANLWNILLHGKPLTPLVSDELAQAETAARKAADFGDAEGGDQEFKIKEMEIKGVRKAQDTVLEQGKKATEEGMTDAIRMLSEWWSHVATQLNKFWEPFERFAAWVEGVWKNLWNNIKNIVKVPSVETFGKLFEDLWKDIIWNPIMNLWNDRGNIGDVLNEFFESVFGIGLTGWYEKIQAGGDKMKEGFRKMGTLISNWWKRFTKIDINAGKAAMNPDTIKNALNQGSANLDNVFSDQGNFNARLGDFDDLSSDVFDDGGKVTEAFDKVGEMFSLSTDNMTMGLDNSFLLGGEKLSMASFDLQNVFTNAWTSFTGAITKLGEVFGGFDKMQAAFDGFLSMFALIDWGGLGKQIVDGIKRSLVDLYETLKSLGGKIFTGLWESLSKNWEKFTKNFSTMGRKIFFGLWNALSGSWAKFTKNFTTMGKKIMYGFWNGIVSFWDKLKDIFTTLGEKVLDGLGVSTGGDGGTTGQIASALGMSEGGWVGNSAKNKANGDTELRWLNPNEYVLPVSMTSNGDLMAIVEAFAKGGMVGVASLASGTGGASGAIPSATNTTNTTNNTTTGGTNTVNLNFNVAAGAVFDKAAVRKAMPAIIEQLKGRSRNGERIIFSSGVY